MSIKAKLLLAATMLLCVLGLCGLSYLLGSSNAFLQSEQSSAAALQKAQLAADKQEQQLKRAINKRVIENTQLKRAMRTNTIEIIKEVPVYVTQIQAQHSVCNITRGTVCLLNRAVQNSTACDSALTAEQAIEPSTITEQALLERVHEYIEQYHWLAADYSALIDILNAAQRSAE